LRSYYYEVYWTDERERCLNTRFYEALSKELEYKFCRTLVDVLRADGYEDARVVRVEHKEQKVY